MVQSAITQRGSRLRRMLVVVAAILCGVATQALPVRAQEAKGEPVRLVALGDSLTAGYGLPNSQAFPVRLEAALKAKGLNVTVANAGVSGDTASDGLARVDWSVPDGTHGVIVELGANDALRGLDPKVTRAALDGIIARLKERGIAVLLAGMHAPRNLGAEYVSAFDAIYPELAAKHSIPLHPFFLDGVATEAKLNQRDGIHPTAEGVDIIVKGILPAVEDFVKALQAAKSG